MKNLRIILFLFFQLVIARVYAQDREFFNCHLIEKIASSDRSATVVLKKLDSVKQTDRRDDEVKVYFDRDIDFGYRQKRIFIRLHMVQYELNLVTKNDTIYLSSTIFADQISLTPYRTKLDDFKIDTTNALRYLSMRNNFYGSSKTIANLLEEINNNDVYAIYCGDGAPKTEEAKQIDSLAKLKQLRPFLVMLQSIVCEEQEYGRRGCSMLSKNGVKLPAKVRAIILHLQQRKSPLVVCSGDLMGVEKNEETATAQPTKH